MAITPSHMIPLNTRAPEFSLQDVVSGRTISLSEAKSASATVIMFICNHCPFVKHIQKELVTLAHAYIPQGITFVAINSNDAKAYPDDSPQNMKKVAEDLNFPFLYLYDETQEVAKAYHATCTPDFFVFDKNLKCVYRGQFDDSRPGNDIPVTGKDLRAALECLLKGEPIPDNQKPSIGCNIKWKP